MLAFYLLLLLGSLVLGGLALAARAGGWRPPAQARRGERLAAGGAFAAAVAIGAWLLFAPTVAVHASARSLGAPTESLGEQRSLTLLEAGQWALVPVLLVLLALTGAPLLLRRRPGRYWAELGGAVLLAGLTTLGGSSIGLYLFPSAALLFLAALFGRPPRRTA